MCALRSQISPSVSYPNRASPTVSSQTAEYFLLTKFPHPYLSHRKSRLTAMRRSKPSFAARCQSPRMRCPPPLRRQVARTGAREWLRLVAHRHDIQRWGPGRPSPLRRTLGDFGADPGSNCKGWGFMYLCLLLIESEKFQKMHPGGDLCA